MMSLPILRRLFHCFFFFFAADVFLFFVFFAIFFRFIYAAEFADFRFSLRLIDATLLSSSLRYA